MEKYKPLLPALGLALVLSSGYSPTLNASDLNYSYVEGMYLITDNDEEQTQEDAFTLTGSIQIMDQLFVNAYFSKASAELPKKYNEYGRIIEIDFDGDITTARVGGGYILPITDNWDINLGAGYERLEITTDEVIRGRLRYEEQLENDGFYIRSGLRGKLTSNIELSGYFDHVSGEDANGSEIILSGHFYLLDNLSAGITTTLDSDGPAFYAGGRLYF